MKLELDSSKQENKTYFAFIQNQYGFDPKQRVSDIEVYDQTNLFKNFDKGDWVCEVVFPDGVFVDGNLAKEVFLKNPKHIYDIDDLIILKRDMGCCLDVSGFSDIKTVITSAKSFAVVQFLHKLYLKSEAKESYLNSSVLSAAALVDSYEVSHLLTRGGLSNSFSDRAFIEAFYCAITANHIEHFNFLYKEFSNKKALETHNPKTFEADFIRLHEHIAKEMGYEFEKMWDFAVKKKRYHFLGGLLYKMSPAQAAIFAKFVMKEDMKDVITDYCSLVMRGCRPVPAEIFEVVLCSGGYIKQLQEEETSMSDEQLYHWTSKNIFSDNSLKWLFIIKTLANLTESEIIKEWIAKLQDKPGYKKIIQILDVIFNSRQIDKTFGLVGEE